MEYKIIYSDRKTVNISVKDGNVIIKAPKKIKRAEFFRSFYCCIALYFIRLVRVFQQALL